MTPTVITVAEAILARWAIPVVFLTAHADPATVARAQATSPYGYLLKPFHEREVAITVQLALAKSASDRQLRASEHLFATTCAASPRVWSSPIRPTRSPSSTPPPRR